MRSAPPRNQKWLNLRGEVAADPKVHKVFNCHEGDINFDIGVFTQMFILLWV